MDNKFVINNYEEVSDILCGDSNDWEYVTEQWIDDHRWYSENIIVVKPLNESDESLFGFEYNRGLTEMQEDDDCNEFPIDIRPITATEVVKTVYNFTK